MIRNLGKDQTKNFVGKNTQANLTECPPGSLNAAKNVVVQNDQQISKAPGYTLVSAVGAGPIRAIYDFERNVDGKQFVLVQSGGSLYYMNADGSGLTLLSSGEGSTGFRFVQNSFAAYGSDGANAYRFVDVGDGKLTKYNWGITAPVSAPTISVVGGTLSLTYGRRYVTCYVSRFTDSIGVQRLSISAPSPMSAHTGPQVNAAITLGSLVPSSDSQVNYVWIFSTTDSPIDTTATFYFEAEIPNSQTSYGDVLPDTDLDETRLAPFDNNPAPPAPVLTTFQNRVVALNDELLQLSGYDEITLGIPEEAWPLSLFFDLPSGNRYGTAMMTQQEGTILLVSSPDYWFSYKGYDASTFTEQDRVAAPGAAGRDCLCDTPFGMAWLSPSKRLWLWNGTAQPTDFSAVICNSMQGTYGMDDLSAPDLASGVLRWFSFGSTHFLAFFTRTSDAPDAYLNLIQIWCVDVSTQASSGLYGAGSSVYGQIKGLYPTDKLPAVSMSAAANVLVNSVPYIYCGDALGNVYRLPDGYADNGVKMQPQCTTGWQGDERLKRYMFVDVVTDRIDAATAFEIYARVAGSPHEDIPAVQLPTRVMPSPDGQTVTVRGNMQSQKGTSVGRYQSIVVEFPNDSLEAMVREITVYSKPIFEGAP